MENFNLKTDESKDSIHEVLGLTEERAREIHDNFKEVAEQDETGSITALIKESLTNCNNLEEVVFTTYMVGANVQKMRAMESPLMEMLSQMVDGE